MRPKPGCSIHAFAQRGMRYVYATPPALPAVDPSARLDDALVREARRLLFEVTSCVPVSTMLDPDARRDLLAPSMARLCVDARLLNVPIERVIIAIKAAWLSLSDVRVRYDDLAPDVVAAAITVCIEEYFAGP